MTDARVLAVPFRGREPPQRPFAGQIRTVNVEFERLLDIGGIQDGNGQRAMVFGPRRLCPL